MEDREINTKIILNHLSECNNRYFTVFQNAKDRNEKLKQFLNVLISTVNALNRVDQKLLRHGLLQKTWNFEVLSYLNKANLIDFKEYFAIKDIENESAKELAENLISCLSTNNTKDLRKSVLEAICDYGKNEQALDGCLMTCFADQCYQKLKNHESFGGFLNSVVEFQKDPAIFYVLTKICTCAFLDASIPVNQALGNSNLYKPSDFENAVQLMRTVVSYAGDVTDVCSFLVDFLLNSSNKDLNSHNISLLVCLVTQQDGYAKIKAIVHELIEESLENEDSSFLTIALLLGRICCLNESGLKLTYLQWFSMTFSSESHRPLNTYKRAKFFLSVLTQLLDYEQPGFLKIYLHKVPFVPSSSQAELSDYLNQAKARLESLNESTEVGLFATESGNDVAVLVNMFEKSGKIPHNFFGAIMLRKKYFDREFLPKLLRQCPGPSTSHHALIQQLAQLGKIGNGVFKKHVESCR